MWWARQLEGSGAKRGTDGKQGLSKRSSKFVPARLTASPTKAAPAVAPVSERHEVEVVLRNGRRVRVSREFQLDALARLLDTVEAGGAC